MAHISVDNPWDVHIVRMDPEGQQLYFLFTSFIQPVILHIASRLPGDQVGVQSAGAAALHKFSWPAGSAVGMGSQE
jgi:hypothetical protein